jgi:hypothetical protein
LPAASGLNYQTFVSETASESDELVAIPRPVAAVAPSNGMPLRTARA